MGRGLEPFSESRTYDALQTLHRWTDSSTVISLLGSERVLLGSLPSSY